MPQLIDLVDPARSQIQQAAVASSLGTADWADPMQLDDVNSMSIGLPEMSRDDFQKTMGPAVGMDYFSKLLAGKAVTWSQPESTFSTKGASGLAGKIIDFAHDYLGQPYVWGALDCSGLVQRVFKRVGINLPRISADQARAGQRISLNKLRPGDLVAWDNSPRNYGADHIAIYIGHGQIIEAPRRGKNVQISGLYDTDRAWGVRILHGGSGRGVSAPGPQNVQQQAELHGSREANRQTAYSFAKRRNWTGNQWYALNRLVMKESGWDNYAQNPHSTAYGIGQFLNGTWATVGVHKTSDPLKQIQALFYYIEARYGTPENALRFHNLHGWY